LVAPCKGDDAAGATARKEKQRPQARRQWLNRVRNAATQKVNLTETEIIHVHLHLLKKTSGQLRTQVDRFTKTLT